MRLPFAMITSQIGSVLKQALTTFSRDDMLPQNLEILKALMEKTTAADVDLKPQFLTDSLWEHPDKAPVTYVDIYQDNTVTLGIFILKRDMKLPLHNHPQMHGIIKVIAGKLRITSYSLNTEKTRQIEKPLDEAESSVPLTPSKYIRNTFITVEKTGDIVVDVNSDCCLLDPEKHNIHQLESVDGPAAFIDILAPPYETRLPGGTPRKCSYYSILRELMPTVFRLQETRAPSWYWSDTFPYTGPELSA